MNKCKLPMNGIITILIWAIIAVSVSFLCSVIEAVMLSLSDAQVAAISETKPKLGYKWEKYKDDISTPLFGVLTLNTISHTAGAGGVGAATLETYGESSVAVASVILTFFILVFSELIPKTIGEKYAKQLAGPTAHAVFAINLLTYPIVKPINYIRNMFPEDEQKLLEVEDVRGMIGLAGDAGIIRAETEQILHNALAFANSDIGDYMTPIELVETAKAGKTSGIIYSKCPLHDALRPGAEARYLRYSAKRQQTDVVSTIRVRSSTPAFLVHDIISNHDLIFVTNKRDEAVGIVCREDILDALLPRPTKG
tara:strand:+ start:640 stop:1569 length:930 start_codon:yes stop_codon:yes gene_type:complete